MRQSDRGAGDVGVSGPRPEGRLELRVGSPVGAAEEAEGELWSEAQAGAVGRLEAFGEIGAGVIRGGGDVPPGAGDVGIDPLRRAAGWVEGEVRPVDAEADVSHPDWNPLEDLGEGVRDRRGLGSDRVDPKRRADRDHAEVIGPDLGGADHDHADRGTLVGAGQVDLAGDPSEGNADSGANDGRADLRAWPGRTGSDSSRAPAPAVVSREAPGRCRRRSRRPHRRTWLPGPAAG